MSWAIFCILVQTWAVSAGKTQAPNLACSRVQVGSIRDRNWIVKKGEKKRKKKKKNSEAKNSNLLNLMIAYLVNDSWACLPPSVNKNLSNFSNASDTSYWLDPDDINPEKCFFLYYKQTR